MSFGIDELFARPNFADLPLGPFAGSTLRYAKTPCGSRLHGGHQCSETQKPTAAIHEFPQPSSGTLADLNLPGDAHCHWDEDSLAYIHAARDLADIRDENQAADAISWDRDAPLGLLQAASMAATNEPPETGLTAALRPAWTTARNHRKRVITQLGDSGRWLMESVVTNAVVARWIAAGRRPRDHDDRFAVLMGQVRTALDQIGRRFDNKYGYRDLLSAFLDHIGQGGAIETADDALVRMFKGHWRMPAEAPTRSVVAHWGGMVRAVSSAFPGKCLAIIEYSHHSWWRDTSLPDMYLSLWGGARFRRAGVDWVACLVPRAHQLLLHDAQRHVGPGLLLHDVWHVDAPEAGAALLRHVVRERVGSGLVDSVATIPPVSMPFLPDLELDRNERNVTRPAPDLRKLTVSAEFIESLQAMRP